MRAVTACTATVLLTGLLSLVLLLPGCFLCRSADPRGTPAGVVEVFFQAFQEKDLETMLNLHQEQNLSPEDRDFLERLAELVEIKSVTVTGVEQLGPDEALVNVEITLAIFGRESTETGIYRVTRRDGLWSISGAPDVP